MTVVVGDTTEGARRFRQFVVLDLVAASAGVVVLALIWLFLGASWLWPLLLATVLSVALLVWALRRYAAGDVDAAVMAVCATFWLELVVAPLVIPSLFGGFAVLMVFPVLFAVPYVQRSTLFKISIATAVAAGIALVLAVRPDPPEIADLPRAVLDISFVLVGGLFVALSLAVTYAYSGRLNEVVDGLRRANEALHASERLLEAKVVERTAELKEANAELVVSREETTRARDQAVGLSRELAAVLDNLGDGLVVVDHDGTVVRVNTALARMLRRSAAELVDRPVADVLPELADLTPDDPSSAVTGEIHLADDRVAKAVASTVTDPDGLTSRGTVVLLSDITAEREIDRMKTDFISTVSHELRTPLTSILGFTKIIAKRLDERIFPAVREPEPSTTRAIGQVRGNLDIIVAEGERLTALINDVLDLAKMEAGRVDWRDEEVDVEDVVRQSVAATGALFEAKQLDLQLELAGDLPPIRGDTHRLEQVVINLLSNACKFTDEGSVTVRSRRLGDEVVVSVRDSGPGIAPEDQAQLFARFKQVGDTLTGKPHGTGLGLPICKEIVEHHRGQLWVDSAVGAGSTFSFSLRLAPGARVSQPVDARTLLRDLRANISAPGDGEAPRILVVDDHAPLRQLLREELEGQGYVVHEARDGNEAVRLAKDLRPSLITLDVMMPDLNGFDVAAVLRHDPATMRIPIMMISILQEEGRARSIGVDSYLTKPVGSAELLAQVETLLAQGWSHRRAVVIDSDLGMLDTLRTTLEQQGWSVTAVRDPDEALDVARSVLPDVVIANAAVSDRSGLVDVMRAERDMEQVVFILFE
jgi:signal transduction histidine kinase/DNA-binding response OmpR family regulator